MKKDEKMLKEVIDRIEPKDSLKAKVLQATEKERKHSRFDKIGKIVRYSLQAAAALVVLIAAVTYGPRLVNEWLVPVEPKENPALVQSSLPTEDMPKYMVFLMPDTDVNPNFLPVACMVALDEGHCQIKEISFVRETLMTMGDLMYPQPDSVYGGYDPAELDSIQKKWEEYTGQKLSGVLVIPQESILNVLSMTYPLEIQVSEEEFILMTELNGGFSGMMDPYETLSYLFVSAGRYADTQNQIEAASIISGQQEKVITAVLNRIIFDTQDFSMEDRCGIIQNLLSTSFYNFELENFDWIEPCLKNWKSYEVVSMCSPADLTALDTQDMEDQVAIELLRKTWNQEIEEFLSNKQEKASEFIGGGSSEEAAVN